MGTQENGRASNISGNLPPSHPIASSTAANPTQITTTGNHGLTTGDTVDISGHLVNVGANGVYVATVTGLTTFTIPVDTSAAAAGNSGTVQSLALGPTFLIPADGVDNEDAASVGVPFEAVADRTAFLAVATGAYKVAAVIENGAGGSGNDLFGVTYATYTITSDNVWFFNDTAAFAYVSGGGIQSTDLVLVDIDTHEGWQVAATSGNTNLYFAAFLQLYSPGVNPATITPKRILNALAGVQTNNASGSPVSSILPLRLSGHFSPGGPTADGSTFPSGNGLNFIIQLQAQTNHHGNFAGSPNIQSSGAFMARVTVLRPTLMPQ